MAMIIERKPQEVKVGIINHKFEKRSLVFGMPENLDATNAREAESEVRTICEGYPDSKIIFDCAKLGYISSTGLRLILRLQQERGDVSLINVNPSVYEILDITGFSEMLEVQKAYRTASGNRADRTLLLARERSGTDSAERQNDLITVYL